MAKLSREIKLLADHLQQALYAREAAAMHGTVRNQLSQAISDAHKDSGYGYYVDHSGDGSTGDVIYQSSGKLRKASYSIDKTDGKLSATIGHDKSKVVQAVTSYKESDAALEEGIVPRGTGPVTLIESEPLMTMDLNETSPLQGAA